MNKDTHCSYCGTLHVSDTYPKQCSHCENVTYANPTPVIVVLIPVGSGVLCIRRANEPGFGELALPGGFMELGETVEQAAAREVFEETGIVLDPYKINLLNVRHFVPVTTSNNGNLLIFVQSEDIRHECLTNFEANAEVSELLVVQEAIELAFPTHTKALKNYYEENWYFSRSFRDDFTLPDM